MTEKKFKKNILGVHKTPKTALPRTKKFGDKEVLNAKRNSIED
jgi:hypothetical protein